jgi:predicted DNA-binding protein (UPF0251 family)
MVQAEIKLEELVRLAKTGATQAEIAWKLGVSVPTLERRLRKPEFKTAFLMGKGDLAVSLRAKQVQIALSGNVQMLKWLGEQLLGQSHTHRIVDKAGEDTNVVTIDSLRAWIQGAPAA